MQHQSKVDRNSIGDILNSEKAKASYQDKRIRISEDFTFYGVTKTKSGEPENSLGLKIIKADGEQLVFDYHEFVSPRRYIPSSKIILSTLTHTITITGKNLGDLIDYIAEHRLMWIKEPDADFIRVPEGEAEISKDGIQIEER